MIIFLRHYPKHAYGAYKFLFAFVPLFFFSMEVGCGLVRERGCGSGVFAATFAPYRSTSFVFLFFGLGSGDRRETRKSPPPAKKGPKRSGSLLANPLPHVLSGPHMSATTSCTPYVRWCPLSLSLCMYAVLRSTQVLVV